MVPNVLAILFCAALPLATAVAQTTVSVPCDLDTTLYAENGNLSNGSGASLVVGTNASLSARRALLHFAVSTAVPSGAKILKATLQVNVAQATFFLPVPANVHRVTQPWGEGGSNAGGPSAGGGAVAQAGDATWTQRVVPGALWATAGGDFLPAQSATIAMPLSGAAVADVPPADVQLWLDNPAQNFGYLLKVANEAQASTAHRLDSRNGGTVPPALLVTYMVPGQVGTWGTGCSVGAGVMVTAFVGTPTGGATIQITQSSSVPSSLGANFFSLELNPFGTYVGLSTCVPVYLSLPIIPGDVFSTDVGGAAATPFSVPSGFPGYLVNCQSVVLDSSPSGFVLGNSALIVLQ